METTTGAYSFKSSIGGESPSYTFSGRYNEKLTSESPGPGAYGNINAPIGRDGPAFSMSGRVNEKSTSDNVGPGNRIEESF